MLQQQIEEELRPDEPATEPSFRQPTPISVIPVHGEYIPDPMVVRYEFIFADTTSSISKNKLITNNHWIRNVLTVDRYDRYGCGLSERRLSSRFIRP